ncbi:MAG TPA: DUF4258 domain-containing protein [Candidatus Yonathbacteria bacterium]|nr:DUF4258 domain-containing protein [Candidatus Yonathbacteria bacterium]
MKIRFTSHAQYRIEERGISILRITSTLRTPGKKRLAYENKLTKQKQFGGKILEVVYIKNKNYFIVITAYYL